MDELLTNSDVKELLTGVDKEVMILHRLRIQRQIGVDGKPFEKLADSTIWRKLGTKGKTGSNAQFRMIATKDFQNNFLESNIKEDRIEFFLSQRSHEFHRTEAAIAKYKAKKGMLRRIKKTQAMKFKNLSYKQIGEYNASDEQQRQFGVTIKRGKNNPGAFFMGLNNQEENQIFRKFSNTLKKKITDNITRSVLNAARI